jgi:hypothetical protein
VPDEEVYCCVDTAQYVMRRKPSQSSLSMSRSTLRAHVQDKEFGSIGKDIDTSGLADANIRLSFTFYGE